MDQRLFLAIALSIAVIIGYYAFFPPPLPERPPAPDPAGQAATGDGTPQPTGAPASPAVQAAAAKPLSVDKEAKERQVVVETPLYRAVFDTRGATLVSLTLNRYKVGKAYINWGDIIPPLRSYLKKPRFDPEATVEMVKRQVNQAPALAVDFIGDDKMTAAFRRKVFAVDKAALRISEGEVSPRRLVFTARGDGGLTLRKILAFHADSYIIDYEVQVINYGRQPVQLRVVNQFGEGPLEGSESQKVRAFYGPIFREDDSVDTETADDIEGRLIVRNPQWLGIASNYFLAAAAPASRISHAEFRAINLTPNGEDEKWVAYYGMELPAVQLAPENMIASKARLYLGPKRSSELEKFGESLEESLDLTLDFLAVPLLSMLRWFYKYTGNYGISIILLTMVVRIGLFPLTYKGMVSMKRMSKLQPKMKAIREKNKNNKEKTNKEMMDLYKRYKINPLGGCLPIAAQIPIFFALYSALLGAIELRHSPFYGWITDLSSMDPLYVTPVLMGASMFFQQRLTPSTMDPAQQRILMWMPVVFTAFMFNFPSGLVLYWLTSNSLSILQQLIINRVKIPDLVEQKT